jgi:long-chain acyl-CoA synthetase
MMDYAARAASANTLPKLLRKIAREHRDGDRFREKDLGVWREFTWGDYQARVGDFALGLVGVGVGKGDVVALIGDNRPDWVAGEIAAHAIGAMSLGMYRDALDEEVAYLLTTAGARIVFAEDEEQVEKLIGLGERAEPEAHRLFGPARHAKYSDPRLISAADLAIKDRERAAREAELYDRLVDATQGDAVAILCTTSGTTAHPKIAMLSAERLLRHCAAYLAFDPKGADDEYVSVLPLPWIMEQVYALGKALLCRMKVNFLSRAGR